MIAGFWRRISGIKSPRSWSDGLLPCKPWAKSRGVGLAPAMVGIYAASPRVLGATHVSAGTDGEEAGPGPPRRDKRLYFVLMAICIGLFVLSWAVVDRYSTTAAVIMTIVALVIPPFAAIVANAYSATDRRRR